MSKDSASSHNSKSQSAQNRQKNRRKNTGQKKPKKITESYLHNAGLYYLERFATSSGNFREVMMRKVKRSCMFHTEQDYDKCAQMVDALVEKFIRTELLNDTAYTRNMVQSLRRKGKSAKSIQLYLRGKKLDSALIISALEERDLETHETASEAELEAAEPHVPHGGGRQRDGGAQVRGCDGGALEALRVAH